MFLPQTLTADKFVAEAGYGDCGMGYICTVRAYTECGYEPTASLIVPASGHVLNRVITDLLAAGARNRVYLARIRWR